MNGPVSLTMLNSSESLCWKYRTMLTFGSVTIVVTQVPGGCRSGMVSVQQGRSGVHGGMNRGGLRGSRIVIINVPAHHTTPHQHTRAVTNHSCVYYGRPAQQMWTLYFCPWVLLSFSFLACSQPLQIGCLPYFHTWCGLSANLRCRSETCYTRLVEHTGRKKSPKIRHLRTIAQICWAISLQLRHVLTIGKKLVKQQYLPQTSLQYGKLKPTSG